MARSFWKKQQKRAVEQRERIRGLQIIPKASFYDDSHGHVPGDSNWRKFGFDLHPHVSLIAGALILLFIGATFLY